MDSAADIPRSDVIAVVLRGLGADALQRAERIAAALGTSVSREDVTGQLRLIVTDERVELHAEDARAGGGVYAGFSAIDIRPRSGNLSRRQPLARAVGRQAKSVIDATAGMGQDAFLLACMGYEVLAIERSPIIAALVEDGLRRATADDRISRAMGGRLRFVQGDARDVLRAIETKPDVVYLDPMFPPKRRASALPKKEIQMLRRVVGDDPDADELFQVARRAALQRVVVKRPPYAPPLAQPTMSLEGKLIRYDVYVQRSDE